MFTVEMKALAASSQDLQQMIRKMNREIQETEDIVSSIRRKSAYSDVIRSLRKQLENLTIERKRMMDMMAALNEIENMYMQCERRITDYGDQVRQMNYYRGMSVIPLSGIRENILEYHIR